MKERYIFVESYGKFGIIDIQAESYDSENMLWEKTPGMVTFKDVTQDEDYIGYDDAKNEMILLCEKMNSKENLKLLLKENLSIEVETCINHKGMSCDINDVYVKVKLFFDGELFSEFSG